MLCAVPSGLASSLNLPGTDVPGYRLFRPSGTATLPASKSLRTSQQAAEKDTVTTRKRPLRGLKSLRENSILSRERAPHLARCSRDVGYHRPPPSSRLRTPQPRPGAPCSHQRCPNFLLRGTTHNHACGFFSKKAARSCSTPPTSTGNPGYVGRKRWAKPTTAFRFELYRSFLGTATKLNGGPSVLLAGYSHSI
jgi:hypothetical protein